MSNIEELKRTADQVVNATQEGENTAARIGGAFRLAAELIASLLTSVEGLGTDNSKLAGLIEGLKTSLSGIRGDLTNETSERKEADNTVKTELTTLLTTLKNELETLVATETSGRKEADNAVRADMTALVEAVSQRLNTLVGNNASELIDNFNEVTAFLSGIKDDETLSALLLAINQRISELETNALQLGHESTTAFPGDEGVEAINIAVSARNGATARFSEVVDNATLENMSSTAKGGRIVYIRSLKVFAYSIFETFGAKYYGNWYVEGVTPPSMFMSEDLSSVLTDKIFLCGGSAYAWSDEEGDLVEISGSGSGSGFYNVTTQQPLETGYYDKATAVAALANAKIKDESKLGMIMTFEVASGKWADYRYIATNIDDFLKPESWEEYGDGKIKSISLNGKSVSPDASGNVALVVDEVEVDETLDTSSTNPVQNKAVAGKFSEIEASTLFNSDVEKDDDGNQTVTLMNKSGATITQFTVEAGGGGGGETASTKIVLGASVSQGIIKEGGGCKLTYTYDHVNAGGEDAGSSTGQKAKIEIRVLRGSILVFGQQTDEVSKGTYTLDISKYLQVGSNDVYVKATTTDPETGKSQSRQAYVNVKVVNLSLQSSYNISNGLSAGGYGDKESAIIPFTVQGAGTKVVSLYLDGEQYDSNTVTKSGTTNGSFSISMGGLAVGRHTVQLVAEMEASEELTLRSESVYFDIFKAGSDLPLIGTKMVFKDGRIFTTDHLTPRLETGQYEQFSFLYAVYDPATTPAAMSVWQNGASILDVNVPRSTQTYSNRFTEQGEQQMKLVCGVTEYPFYIDVSQSSIDISEATYGLELKLSAAGRSNDESDPAHWEYGDVKTTFENVDWNSSGWTGESLKLINGAKAHIDFHPFVKDAATTGCTIEVELKVSNIIDKDSNVVSCLDDNKGFQVTADKAMMYTGSTKEIEDEDGNKTTQKVGVGRQYGSDMWVKIAFVIGKRTEGRLMELYVNGGRAAADIYGDSDNFVQATAKGIDITSDGADVEVRTVRLYDRALYDDEETDNHIVDRQTLDEMIKLWQVNDVLADDGKSIDFHKLRDKDKAVMLVVRPGGLAPVNAENNKKTDFLADVHIWLPDGRYIYLKNVYIRIQGTSSTKYPSKNYRIYCAKGQNPEMYINGVKQDELKLELRIGQKKVEILCAKADYSDSSMAQNTGGAKLWNNMMKALGFLTPPQMVDSSVRTAVDGFPVDVFSSESMEETPQYYGQYNLNHDKSDWQEIIGMEGVDGFTPEQPIAFEFLNNTQPLCLFQGNADLDAQAAAEFDNALEFNYPAKTGGEDTKWANSTPEQKAAFKRLWGWIRDCVPAGANPDDLSTFVSAKFKAEVDRYFNKNFLLCWWLFTDFFADVDQKVKNLILATWNALVWYFIFYDGDTGIGDRNDSMLAYLYNVMRETWDAEKNKYAFEGHDSWLWCLVLANLKDEVKEMAARMREVLTLEEVNRVFDEEQQSNWCTRVFNKSGELKYIKPQTEGVETSNGIVKYPYVYALKGDKKAFRHWFLSNRFALLDAKYETGNYLSDNIDMYMTRQASTPVNTIDITSNELYYFGYGTNNSPHLQPSEEADKGEMVTLVFGNAFTVNDPIRLYGASRIAELDMRGAADNLTGDLNLNKCKVLRKLDISTKGKGSSGWCMVLDQCRQLTDVNLNGQANAKTGTLSSTELDFSRQNKLKTLDARGVNVQAVLFAQGCPLTTAQLGSNIQTLRLEYLPQLQESGLTLQDWETVRTLRFAGCPRISWQSVIGKCVNVERIRIEGIDLEDDGTLLERYKNLKGIDANGNAVDYCALVGTVHLNHYMEDERYQQMAERFPELNIVEPEYTMIRMDNISDDESLSNMDNGTGYLYGSQYVPSGHILAIAKKRHRVLSKVTKMPTTRKVRLADTDIVVNNPDGETTYYPLHDEDSRYYADAEKTANCTPAKLDGSEGDIMMLEPDLWCKGINDYLNNAYFSCYSSNDRNHRPSSPEADILTLEDIQDMGGVITGKKIVGKDTLAASYANDANYSVCQIDVSKHKRVRFPSVPGASLVGSVFCDADGNLLENVVVPSVESKFEAGMYLIKYVPQNAVTLNFSILNTAEFDKVVLSNSDKIEDMEPDWYLSEQHLCAVVETVIVDGKLRSCITGGSSVANMSWIDFQYYSQKRGMQQIDFLMHSRIANLSYATYGRRDMQVRCGAGTHNNNRNIGLEMMQRGMTDTIGYDYAKAIDPDITNSIVDNVVHQYAWFVDKDFLGNKTVTRVDNICCLCYVNTFGHKGEFLDGVDLPNSNSANTAKWRIMMPDGSFRWVKGGTSYGMWITGVAHGLFMDMVPVGIYNGSSSTYFTDAFWVSTSAGRVVYRGYYYAYASGGVSYAYASSDASNANANVGSRLAFRGEIVKAKSVEAYKALAEVA